MQTDRLLVFGGAYGNLQAAEALFRVADELGLDPDQIVCTGDLVAYCAEPQETVDLIRDRGVHVVMGNCEESLASDSDDCGCGFEEGTQCDLLSRQWYDYCRGRVSDETRAWMGDLPRSLQLAVGSRRLLFFHGSIDAINGFVFPSTDGDVKKTQLDASGCDGIVCGHSGLPFMEFHHGKLWLNSGALGMPANDGTPRGWYSLLKAGPDGVEVSIRGLTYDSAAAAAAMRRNGLENGYAECLLSGLWPSLDILPEVERRRTGVAIVPPDAATW